MATYYIPITINVFFESEEEVENPEQYIPELLNRINKVDWLKDELWKISKYQISYFKLDVSEEEGGE